MDLLSPDPHAWPFEAHVEYPDGKEYSQFARDNGDGTVSIISWEEGGPVVKLVSGLQVKLKIRPWEKARAWRDLYSEVYGEKETEDKANKESLDEFLRVGRELVARGELPDSELKMLEEMEDSFLNHTQDDWADYNFFNTNFPPDTADLTLLIARGHFLIGRKIQDLGAPDQIPPGIWRTLGELNSLREQVVRGATSDMLIGPVDNFIAGFNLQRPPKDRGGRLATVIRFLYGALRGLVQPSREGADASE